MKRDLTPEERAELKELRGELRSLLAFFERYRDRLEFRAAEREKHRQRLSRLSFGLLGRR